jgi:hypothetical protein
LNLKPDTVREVYLEGVGFSLLLVKQIFVNEVPSPKVLGEHVSVPLCRKAAVSRPWAHRPNLEVRLDGLPTFR